MFTQGKGAVMERGKNYKKKIATRCNRKLTTVALKYNNKAILVSFSPLPLIIVLGSVKKNGQTFVMKINRDL